MGDRRIEILCYGPVRWLGSKDASHQTWPPEYNPQDPSVRRRDQFPFLWPPNMFFSTHTLSQIYMLTHKIHRNKIIKRKFALQWLGDDKWLVRLVCGSIRSLIYWCYVLNSIFSLSLKQEFCALVIFGYSICSGYTMSPWNTLYDLGTPCPLRLFYMLWIQHVPLGYSIRSSDTMFT